MPSGILGARAFPDGCIGDLTPTAGRWTKLAVRWTEAERVGHAKESDRRQPAGLLRADRDRPRRRAADKGDEGAPFHSITSSARASRGGGTSRPSNLAIAR